MSPRPDRRTLSEQPLLTVPEACAQLRISRWSLYRLIRQNRLRTVKIGSRRLVPSAALEELVEGLAGDAG